VASVFTGRFVRGLLFEVSPLDPTTMAAVMAMLLVTAAGAAAIPARRATRIDPSTALTR
jgi:ABC-type lipoprotein release transport system permease subunit